MKYYLTPAQRQQVMKKLRQLDTAIQNNPQFPLEDTAICINPRWHRNYKNYAEKISLRGLLDRDGIMLIRYTNMDQQPPKELLPSTVVWAAAPFINITPSEIAHYKKHWAQLHGRYMFLIISEDPGYKSVVHEIPISNEFYDYLWKRQIIARWHRRSNAPRSFIYYTECNLSEIFQEYCWQISKWADAHPLATKVGIPIVVMLLGSVLTKIILN